MFVFVIMYVFVCALVCRRCKSICASDNAWLCVYVCECVCVCVCVVTLSLFHNGGGYLFDKGVQKISVITKVHSDNVRNIFLKLAEFNKFYLKF